jgi:hypothetical protein
LVGLFAVHALATPSRADTVAGALAPLPDFVLSGTPTARVNTLTVSLDPTGADLTGKPGETVGWGFRIGWASNAGDNIVFTSSLLVAEPEPVSSTGYVDLMAETGGNFEGRMLAGTEWQTPEPFVPGTHGTGYLTIKADAIPGTSYAGQLHLRFVVYDVSGATPMPLNTFSLPIDVSVSVTAPEPLNQTITFAEIAAKAVSAAPFAVAPTSSSLRAVEVLSLTPEICSVADGLVTIHAAGSALLVAVQEGDDFYLPAEPVYQSFEVTKVSADVTIEGAAERNYDGTDKLFTAVTQPAALPVKWLYNGAETPPREPGIYAIDALIDDPVYAGSAKATLAITDASPAPLVAYADWLLANFNPQEIQDGLVVAKDADVAGDGASNLLKYAFGLDPWTTMSAEARAALPRLVSDGGANALVFELPVIATGDLIIKVEASSDLTTWEEIGRRTRGGGWTGTASIFTGTPDEAGVRAQTLVTEPPLPVYPRRFYRLNIDFAP